MTRSWAYNRFGVLMGTSGRASGRRWPSLRGDVLPMITLFPSQGDFCVTAFFVFMAAVTLAVVSLSEQLRQKLRLFMNRHFYRARYDYRQKWTTFTERTTSVVDVQGLCA